MMTKYQIVLPNFIITVYTSLGTIPFVAVITYGAVGVLLTFYATDETITYGFVYREQMVVVYSLKAVSKNVIIVYLRQCIQVAQNLVSHSQRMIPVKS